MDRDTGLRSKTLSGLLWRFAERCGAQGVGFVVSVVLARLLAPEDYGKIAMVTVFMTLGQTFAESGLGSALIQKKDADDLDFSTVFFANLALGCAVYGLLFFTAPLVAAFYEKPELAPVVRVLGFSVILSSLKNVQQAYVSRQMLFRRFFFATLGGTAVSAAVGIAMAARGFGVWALVTQQLVNAAADTLLLWLTVGWGPKRTFSLRRLRALYAFGGRLLVSALVNTLYIDIRQLIIGKLYDASALAYYNRGQSLPSFAAANINSSLDSVLLPVMARAQDDPERLRAVTRRAIRCAAFLLWPVMLGLAAAAEPLVRLLLTEKWSFCVPYLRIFCVVYALQPVQTANLNAVKALGRSDLFLRLELVKKSLGLGILLLCVRHGVMAIAASSLAAALLAHLLNSYPNKRLLGYGYLAQLRDILPYAALSLGMGAAVRALVLLGLPDPILLPLQITVGAAIYLLGARLLRLEAYTYTLQVARELLKKR